MTLHRPGWQRVICAASGPSLSLEQCALAMDAQRHGWRIIVTNNTWQRIPSADILYAADAKWFDVYLPAVRDGFRGELWTQDRPSAEKYGLHHIHAVRGDGLPKEPDRICQGSNSGHQVIGLAARLGALRIVLLGFDMSRAPDGKRHWHDDHVAPLGNGDPASWVVRFTRLADDLAACGIDVSNATLRTALTQFRREPLDVALGLVPA